MKKWSKSALLSLFFGLFGCVLFALIPLVTPASIPASGYGIILAYSFIILPLIWIIAVAGGIMGLKETKKRPAIYKGRFCAIAGIIIGLISLLFMSLLFTAEFLAHR